MVPNVTEARERSKMTREIASLSAQGHKLLLESIAASEPTEVQRLHAQAVPYLKRAQAIAEEFKERFPNSLNLTALGV